MNIAGIINGHMQLYPHFVKNISQFPIGPASSVVAYRSPFPPFFSHAASFLASLQFENSTIVSYSYTRRQSTRCSELDENDDGSFVRREKCCV